MTGDDVEVYFEGGEWRVGVPLGEDPISSHGSQDQAIEAGRAAAERLGVELIVRNERATITSRSDGPGGVQETSG